MLSVVDPPKNVMPRWRVANMDRIEARKVLLDELETYKKLSYSQLREVAVQPVKKRAIEIDVKGESGTAYYIQILISWDGKEETPSDITGIVDNRRLVSIVMPTSSSFLVYPDGHVKS